MLESFEALLEELQLSVDADASVDAELLVDAELFVDAEVLVELSHEAPTTVELSEPFYCKKSPEEIPANDLALAWLSLNPPSLLATREMELIRTRLRIAIEVSDFFIRGLSNLLMTRGESYLYPSMLLF